MRTHYKLFSIFTLLFEIQMGRKQKSGTIFKFRPSEEVKIILSDILKGEKTKFVEDSIVNHYKNKIESK